MTALVDCPRCGDLLERGYWQCPTCVEQGYERPKGLRYSERKMWDEDPSARPLLARLARTRAPNPRWVNAKIEIVIPLNTVRTTDSPYEKQAALGAALDRLLGYLPKDLQDAIGLCTWQDEEM